MHELLDEALRRRLLSNQAMQEKLKQISGAVARGESPPVQAVQEIVKAWLGPERSSE